MGIGFGNPGNPVMPDVGQYNPPIGLPVAASSLQLLGTPLGNSGIAGNNVYYDPGRGTYYYGTSPNSVTGIDYRNLVTQIAEAPAYAAMAKQMYAATQANAGQNLLKAQQPPLATGLASSMLSSGVPQTPSWQLPVTYQSPLQAPTVQQTAPTPSPAPTPTQTPNPSPTLPQPGFDFFGLLRSLQSGNMTGQAGAGTSSPQPASATSTSSKRNSGRSAVNVPQTPTQPQTQTRNYSAWTPQPAGPWWRGGQSYA